MPSQDLALRLQQRLADTVPGAELAPTTLPLAPELSLWLLTEDYPRGPLPPEVIAAVTAHPAYWAFCWAAGQALAARLLAEPERVRGRTVLDFGAGSGVAGIAAARAGAARVVACDLDGDARLACEANAALNGVKLELADDLASVGHFDLALVADVLYDRDNLPLLDALADHCDEVLLADARVRPEVLTDWESFAECDALTLPDLEESKLYRTVRFYRRRGAPRPEEACLP
ncbi:MAG: 50S ribosomal protein L11 methyltransferase [Pseudomonadales bacterium]|jgi:predicted nicotinamide N-methyase|nr:50S ribosomal protein L11 methyltransferase [Pseudomonadales bacterium]